MRITLLISGLLAGCSFTLDLEGPPLEILPGDGQVDRALYDATPIVRTDAEALDATALDAQGVDATADAAPDARPDAAPACVPGARLGPCLRCDDDGRPGAPETDPECPAVACAPRLALFDGYCLEYRFAPQTAACAAPGRCADRPAACGPSTDTLLAVAAPCERIEGCVEGAPPEVVREPEGTPCNQGGICDADGACSVPEECFFFGEAVELCETRVDDRDRVHCTAYIRHQDGAQRSCTAVCSDIGAECVTARRPGDDGCAGGEAISCDLLQSALVCHCRGERRL